MNDNFETVDCALRSTKTDREKSGSQKTTNNNRDGDLALDASLQGEFGANTGRAETEPERGALSQKARDFHARIAAARKIAGNCGRCGKPNNNGHKQCDRCRAYQAAYKAGNRIISAKEALNKNPLLMTELIRRIESLELAVARLDLWKSYTGTKLRTYNRRMAAIKREREKAQALRDAMPTMSLQEAATISHKYERQ